MPARCRRRRRPGRRGSRSRGGCVSRCAQQLLAIVQPVERHAGHQAQVFQARPGRHERPMGRAAIGRVFRERLVHQADVRRQPVLLAFQIADHRAERRAIDPLGIAGPQRVGAVLFDEVQAAQDRQLVHDLGLPGHQLAAFHARHVACGSAGTRRGTRPGPRGFMSYCRGATARRAGRP